LSCRCAEQPTLAAGSCRVVHVWTVDLDTPPLSFDAALATMTPGERARAERFRFPRDRVRFVVGRGALRRLLGTYLRRDPARVRLTCSARGKPSLDVEAGSSLRFNLSHSGGRAVYAVSAGRELGVDVERVEPLVDMDAIASRFFSPRERTALSALSGLDRELGFYRCWTRKEAFLKALGEGLSRPLRDFDVGVLATTHASVLHVGWKRLEAGRWSLVDLDQGPGFVGSLAVEGPRPTVEQRTWSTETGELDADELGARCA
jgi:4'-phosphopantetheinyl transferase